MMMISKTCFATVVGSFLLLACTCARADSFTLGFSAGSASADATGLINFSWASDAPAGYSFSGLATVFVVWIAAFNVDLAEGH
jgi:hypothetical protein